MTNFRFKADLVLAAANAEDLLSMIAGHLGDTARHLGNGIAISDACKHFSIEETKADAVELDDHILAANGPAALDLDPKSPAGVAYAEQLQREKTERETMAAARANEGKSDAEIMAEFSAREQAELNKA